MKKQMCAVLALAAAAGAANAANRVQFYDTFGSSSSDGFVTDLASNGYNSPVGDYISFCLELEEHLGYNTEYEYTVSGEVRNNGGAGTRTLNSTEGRRVAYIYSAFIAGGASAIRGLDATFAGYTDRETYTLFQRYIWDRFAYPDGDDWGAGTLYSNARFDLLTSAADANGAQSGLHGVRVMNVWAVGHAGDDRYGKQDQLTMIPLPSTAAMAMVGLGGLSIGRRRRA